MYLKKTDGEMTEIMKLCKRKVAALGKLVPLTKIHYKVNYACMC